MMIYNADNRQNATSRPQDLTICGDKTSVKGTLHSLWQKMPSRLRALAVMIMMVFGGVAWGQTTVEIGTGTSTGYYPIPGFYGWQYDVYLYTPSEVPELNEDYTFNSIAYNISSTANTTTVAGWTIWIKDVDANYTLNTSTTFATYTSGASQVYNSTTETITATGWKTLNFNSPFIHEGGKALLVAVYGRGCTNSGGCSRYCHYTSATGTHWYKHQDNSDPGTGVTGNIDAYRSNIRLTYTAVAPAASVPYSHSFENTTENGNWTIKNGSYTNKWVIGTSTYSSSNHSLYITNAATPNANSANEYTISSAVSYVYAYRKINFATTGEYTVSFKWKGRGEYGCWDAMYAALVPPNTACPPASDITSSTNSLPASYINVADVSGSYNTTGVFLWTYNESGWITSTKDVNITTTGEYTLVFYWKNDGGGGNNPPAAVDDISITTSCTPPTMTLSGGNLTCTLGGSCTGRTLTTNSSGTRHWTSSDPSVATVDPSTGEVTMVGAGSTTITVNVDAADSYCARTASYTLTVNCPTMGAPTVEGGYRCGTGTVDLSATSGSGGTTCNWYTVPSGGSATYTGTAITTPSINATTTYYVASYDATSGCESSTRTPVTATVYNSTITYTGSTTYAENATVSITLTSSYSNYTWTSNYDNTTHNTSTITGTAYPGLEFHATASEHGCDASVDIPITVIQTSGGQACGVIYCSTSGNDSYDGTSTQPVKTLARALTLATGGTASSPVVIRMASGTYDINAPVNLISNVIIDGGWTVTTGIWTKGTTATEINRTATSPEGGSTSPRITAIEGNSKSNFILQDLTIKTANAPTTSGTYGNYGISTYGVHLKSCSGYKFVRCKIQAGKASNGGAGNTGSSGTNGGNGYTGTSSSNSNSSKTGGTGGTNSSCNDNSTKGGKGGNSGTSGNRGSGGQISGTSGNQNNGGSVGGDGQDGSTGTAGSTGTSYAGQQATVTNNSTYFGEYFKGVPGRNGGNGTNGTGGNGGGGGGGTDNWVDGCENAGGSGGGGGAGGCGGGGGYGGKGGGSSFGVYLYSDASTNAIGDRFVSCSITTGTVGAGGTGGTGGTGGAGGSGGSGGSGGRGRVTVPLIGNICTATSGNGGKGGNGGSGGKGGNGEQGANGVAYKIAVVTSAGACTPTTTGYTTTIYNYISSIDYGESSKTGCTNSQIFVTKNSSGSYLGTGAQYVNDLTDESTSSPSGNNAAIYYTSTGLDYKALTNTTQYNPYIFITQERSLGTISGGNGFCYGSITPVAFTYDGDIKEDDYLLWRILSLNGKTQYGYLAVHAEYDDDSDGTKFEVTPSTLPGIGTYLIKLEIINECCGISIPIWKTVTLTRLEATIEFGP